MARSIRLQFSGAYYHVMARGNRREAIYRDDDDRRFFLSTLSEACQMTGWRVQAWVLMGNHYHLFLQTPEPNLVNGMQWLQNTYTRRFNTRHRVWGRLFGDRYKAVVVQPDDPAQRYYQTLMDYIHLNPVRAKLVRPARGESVLDYPWSSVAGGYALPPTKRAPWLAAEDGLRAFELSDTTEGRQRMVERLDKRAVEEEAKRCGVPLPEAEADARMSHLRRGWYWGTQAFAEKMLKLAGEVLPQAKARNYRSSSVRKAHDERQAEAWLREGLKAAGLTESDLAGLKGSHPCKVALARLLWQRTTVSQSWLASRLHMKSAANVSQVIKRPPRQRGKGGLLPRSLAVWLQSVEI